MRTVKNLYLIVASVDDSNAFSKQTKPPEFYQNAFLEARQLQVCFFIY